MKKNKLYNFYNRLYLKRDCLFGVKDDRYNKTILLVEDMYQLFQTSFLFGRFNIHTNTRINLSFDSCTEVHFL